MPSSQRKVSDHVRVTSAPDNLTAPASDSGPTPTWQALAARTVESSGTPVLGVLVEQVLALVPGLSPDDVSLGHWLVGHSGQTYRAEVVLTAGEGTSVAVEVEDEDAAQTSPSPVRHEVLAKRADLNLVGITLLNLTSQQVNENPQHCIAAVQRALAPVTGIAASPDGPARDRRSGTVDGAEGGHANGAPDATAAETVATAPVVDEQAASTTSTSRVSSGPVSTATAPKRPASGTPAGLPQSGEGRGAVLLVLVAVLVVALLIACAAVAFAGF